MNAVTIKRADETNRVASEKQIEIITSLRTELVLALNEIYALIDESANNGEFSVELNEMTTDIQLVLIDDGYTINGMQVFW